MGYRKEYHWGLMGITICSFNIANWKPLPMEIDDHHDIPT